jgi:hypothetical protein
VDTEWWVFFMQLYTKCEALTESGGFFMQLKQNVKRRVDTEQRRFFTWLLQRVRRTVDTEQRIFFA